MKYISLRDFVRLRFKIMRMAKKNSIYKLKVSHYKSCLGKKKISCDEFENKHFKKIII